MTVPLRQSDGAVIGATAIVERWMSGQVTASNGARLNAVRASVVRADRDVRGDCLLLKESPKEILALRDPDARRPCDPYDVTFFSSLERYLSAWFATHVLPVVRAGHAEGPRQDSRATEARRRIVVGPGTIHEVSSAQEDRARETRLSRHDVHAPVNAVAPIDVHVSRGAKHDLGARCSASIGVRRRIVGSVVGFGFVDAGVEFMLGMFHDHDASNEFVCDNLRGASEEVPREAIAHDPLCLTYSALSGPETSMVRSGA
jgi:hypothetical protein